jgi:hypothetical protein
VRLRVNTCDAGDGSQKRTGVSLDFGRRERRIWTIAHGSNESKAPGNHPVGSTGSQRVYGTSISEARSKRQSAALQHACTFRSRQEPASDGMIVSHDPTNHECRAVCADDEEWRGAG